MKIQLKKQLEGRILDIGGGGEGVIGRLYGDRVVAIDNRQDELDESPDGFHKVLMDARNLRFYDSSFDAVTFFYSLMYMDEEAQKEALIEAARVLRPGGILCIWDADILIADSEPFMTELDIDIDGKILHTTYGIVGDIKNQTIDSIGEFCKQTRKLSVLSEMTDAGHFYIEMQKDVVP